ncbi:hypothetical protein SEA_ZOOMAN_333 [Microbacterium phage Zooman]|nr:hypothetical protein SEA_ZOOMAN_20 [Microbacterium phage Zooman]UDL16574.1 hypothetical protein SEA_ZOOMAN_333 [Microbacterium phage Zooman]
MATTTAERRNKKTIPGLNVTNDAELLAKVQRIRELKAVERAGAAAERTRKELEAELRLAMGSEEQIVVRGQVIASLSSLRHATKPNYDLMKSAFPEAYSQCVTQVPYKFVQVASDAAVKAIVEAL